MMAPRFKVVIVASLNFLLFACNLAGTGSNPVQLQKHGAPDSSYTVYKPREWKVRDESAPDSIRLVIASADGTSSVDVYNAVNPTQKADALRLLAQFSAKLRVEHPNLTLSEVFVSPDRARAVSTVSYAVGKTTVRGRYYFDSSASRWSVQGYCAPAVEFPQKRELLLGILANVRFSRAESAPETQPIKSSLAPRRASDGSLTINLPPDWKFEAAAGKILARDAQNGVGFVFTSMQVLPPALGVAPSPAMGVLVSPYAPPAQFIPFFFEQFGNRNVRVRESRPDYETMRAFPAYTGGSQCQAEDIVLSWISPEGKACLGSFKMINGLPSPIGVWTAIVGGAWGPEAEFARWVPLLVEIGSSFRINDQFAAQYIQKGLENLKILREKTSRAMSDLNRAREENQAAWERRQAIKDASDTKWDDYRRGNSYWVSEMEGGKVYATDQWGTRDTHTGTYIEGKPYDYTHFEGKNPRHPSETMREVSSYELEQILGRKP